MKFVNSSLGRMPGMLCTARFWLATLLLGFVSPVFASSEANLVLPDLKNAAIASFLGGMSGWNLLAWGLVVCVAGLVFGAVI